MERSLAILMDGLIDYAGLFPPASLGMRTAVGNFAAYARGPEASWLGRFVLPAARLEEFAEAATAEGVAPSTGDAPESPGSEGAGAVAAGPWRLSALLGEDFPADLARVRAFGSKAATQGPLAPRIDVVELKAARPGGIVAALESIPPGMTAYFEIPRDEDPVPFLDVLKAAGGRAKLRTGGVTPELIPAPMEIARFLEACARAGVPFKATAGLHHPIRSRRRLTYAPDGPVAVMHGFLNVFLAAALAAEGAPAGELALLLEEEDPGALRFDADGAAWRGRRVPCARLEAARGEFAVGFGSCSFDEPRRDLAEAKLL